MVAWQIITDEARAAGLAKIREKVKELDLDDSLPRIEITSIDREEESNDPVKESTLDRYKSCWKGLLDFCILIGDYESGIILHRKCCPRNPLPVSLRTAVLFARFKHYDTDYILKDPDTNEVVKNIYGDEVRCIHMWQSRRSIDTYVNSLRKIHSHYGSCQGPYGERCNGCRALGISEAQKGVGCTQHLGQPHYERRGSPALDPRFLAMIKIIEKHADETYHGRTTIPFIPSQLRQLRTHLLSQNDLECLMIWTIIVVGVKLFLRVEEVLNLCLEDFLTKYFVVMETGKVEGLCVSVRGKTDNEAKALVLWDDDVCPEFSPTRALLIYLGMAGIKPATNQQGTNQQATNEQSRNKKKKRKKRKKGGPDGEGPEPTGTRIFPIEYQTFLRRVRQLCKQVLGMQFETEETEAIIIGTHMLRKTAFLLAYWGRLVEGARKVDKMDEADILLSARHKDVSMTAAYLGDSSTMHELTHRLDKNLGDQASYENRVGPWNPIHLKTLPSWEKINAANLDFNKDILQLADCFVRKLGVASNTQNRFLVSTEAVHQLAMTVFYRGPAESDYKDAIQSLVPPHLLERVMEAVNGYSAERVRVALDRQANILGSSAKKQKTSPAPATVSPGKATPPTMSKTGRPIFQPSKDFKNLVKAVDGRDKLSLMVECVSEIRRELEKTPKPTLVQPFSSFANRTAKVVDCLETCHGGDMDSFLASNKVWTSKFCEAGAVCGRGVKHGAVGFNRKST